MDIRWGGVTVDCTDPERVAGFWRSLLGRDPGPSEEGWVYLGERDDALPRMVFQPVTEPKRVKNRLHFDLTVDDLPAAMERVAELGGSFTGERHDHDEGVVVVMTDPEGNEFCLTRYVGS